MEICEVLVVVDRVTRFDIEEQGVTQDRHDEEEGGLDKWEDSAYYANDSQYEESWDGWQDNEASWTNADDNN